MRDRYRAGATALLLLLLATTNASACACCSNAGQRGDSVESIDTYAAGVLSELRFARQAHLQAGEADLAESLRDLGELQLSVSQSGEEWVFAIEAATGASGKLTFKRPALLTKFQIDPRDPDQAVEPNGPVLYKEWRLIGKVQGSGIFEKLGADQATLIFHGRGNSCTDASQFTAWTIVLPLPDAMATLFGDLLQH